MCVVSMIMDHRIGKWNEWVHQPVYPNPLAPPPVPSPGEIEDFRKLYEMGKEYDRKTGQPDCELEDKKRILRELAEKLGVGHLITFLDEDQSGKD